MLCAQLLALAAAVAHYRAMAIHEGMWQVGYHECSSWGDAGTHWEGKEEEKKEKKKKHFLSSYFSNVTSR